MEVCNNPVFVVGSPRSGTTVLAWALAQHSNLWTSAESQILIDLFGDGRLDKNYRRDAKGQVSWLTQLNVKRPEFLGYLGLGISALFTSRSQGKRWVDHTPPHTLMCPDLAEMFPGSKFIHILRDGRRVVHSMINYFKRMSAGPASGRAQPPGWSDFRVACRTWASHVDAGLSFCAKHPTRAVSVVNEELAAQPVKGFKQILSFLSEPYEEASAEYFRTNRLNSSFQSPRETTAEQLPDPWTLWTDEQRTIFLEEAAATMVSTEMATADEIETLRWMSRATSLANARARARLNPATAIQ
jgi:hypothetical protein